uniref:Uncharacterized protein n=1 Tax=Nelumbo nucifera TaxID=4432 RepID=A0A822ZQJ5_NELNU|nr:TPA_asm: hypothetical protein HUJ06_016697 [Nelumbo nucifera]
MKITVESRRKLEKVHADQRASPVLSSTLDKLLVVTCEIWAVGNKL